MKKFVALLCTLAVAATLAVAQAPSGGSTSTGSGTQSDTSALSKEKAGEMQNKETNKKRKGHHKKAKRSSASMPENPTTGTSPK